MTSLILGRDSKLSISFVTTKGMRIGFPMHWLNFWTLEGDKLKIVFHSHTIELQGILLDRIIELLEEGVGFKIIQIARRYVENGSVKDVIIWGIDLIANT